MTPGEQLELVRRSYAAFAAMDAEALVQLYTTDCEWELGAWGAAFGTDVVRGHEGLRAWLSDGLNLVDHMTLGILEVRALDDYLLLHGDGNVKFKSGIETPMPPYWQEIIFAGDRIARVKQLGVEPSAWRAAARLPL